MSRHDPRFSIHPPTIQQLPETYDRPRKRLSHTVKAPLPSGRSGGMFQGILARARKGNR